MAFCSFCGTQVPDDIKFCTGCGKPMPLQIKMQPSSVQQPVAQPQPAYTAPAPPQQVYAAPPPPQPVYAPPAGQPYAYAAPADPNAPLPPGSKYEPITTGGYIGIMLLMLLPVINFILLLVWACGGCRKVNKTNFARAMLIVMLISMVLSGILFLVFGNMYDSILGDVTDVLKATE